MEAGASNCTLTCADYYTSVDSRVDLRFSIAVGFTATAVLRQSGKVVVFGDGEYGMLADGASTNVIGDDSTEMGNNLASVDLGVGMTAVRVCGGARANHACAILSDGSIKCWGRNGDGQLGQDNSDNVGDDVGEMGNLQPINLGVGRTAIACATAAYHTCVLLDQGDVKCFGSGGYGVLGQGDEIEIGSNAGDMAALGVIDLGTGATAIAVVVGTYHSCALLDDGRVKCWGYSSESSL